MKQEFYLDILGVTSREDCYTNLIVHAFKNSPNFRKGFLDELGLLAGLENLEYEDWQIETRLPVFLPVLSEGDRKRDVPDILLHNQKANIILVIENKIYAGEGEDQTNRYGSEKFSRMLTKLLKMDDAKMYYFYLPLDGSPPKNPVFQLLRYSSIAKSIIPCDNKGAKLDLLLNELKKLIEGYDSYPRPKHDENIGDYLKGRRRDDDLYCPLVDKGRTFTLLTDKLLENNRVSEELKKPKEYGFATSNPGAGYSPLCWWGKKEWISETKFDDCLSGYCHHIHFEFQWKTKPDIIEMYLHYETNPYMTQRKDFNKKPLNLQDRYNTDRKNFFSYLKDNEEVLTNAGWTLSNGKSYLKLATHSFKKEKTFKEFENISTRLIESMTPIVDECLGKKLVL